MTRLARTERDALCASALQAGQHAATLCEGWDVKDLVVHLLVREGSPAAIGLVLPPLAGLAGRATRRIGRADFPSLVERVRVGPPRLSPYAVPKLDELANTLEYYVHHEDVRRARDDWAPRDLDAATQRTLWDGIGGLGRLLARRAPDGLAIEDSSTGTRRVLKKGEPQVTLRGLPGEVVLFLFGRGDHARVELVGDGDAVDRLTGASFGA